MEFVVFVIIIGAVAWAALFAYQAQLRGQLAAPATSASPLHPTIAVQRVLSAASERGWNTSLEGGSTVVARHGSTGTQIRVTVAERAPGSELTARVDNVRRGSIAGVGTSRGGQAIQRKRAAMLASTSS